MRFDGELDDLEKVRAMGEKWGYGNCIQYLQHAWAAKLEKEYELPPRAAARGALMSDCDVESYAKGFRVLGEHQ